MNQARGDDLLRVGSHVCLAIAGLGFVAALGAFHPSCVAGADPLRLQARAQLQRVKVALERSREVYGGYPRATRAGVDAAPELFAALCAGPDRFLDDLNLETEVGLVERARPSRVRPLSPQQRELFHQEGFLRAYGPDRAWSLVLLDPWGRPLHYREWRSVPRGTKERLAASPEVVAGVDQEERDGPPHDVLAPPHDPEAFDLWSGGPDRRNDGGAACSDDVRSWGDPHPAETECAEWHPALEDAPARSSRFDRLLCLAGLLTFALGLIGSRACQARLCARCAARARPVPAPVRAPWPLRLRARVDALRCAFCHDALLPVEACCPDCGVQLHDECALELARCPTLGCGGGALAEGAVAGSTT